jgi:hypothetical protein
MASYEDLWYAAKATRLVYLPPRLLETFGESNVQYQVFSEDLDNPSLVHLRHGQVTAARPQIITPHCFLQEMTENFSEEAKQYLSEVMSKDDTACFLRYGLRFSKQEYGEETFGGQVEECAEQAAKDAQDDFHALRGVVIGDDDTWEISLLHLITTLVKRSLPHHARQLADRGLLAMDRGVPFGVRQEIQAEFAACDTLSKARNLGAKLRDYGLFEQYEDEFYSLYRKFKA